MLQIKYSQNNLLPLLSCCYGIWYHILGRYSRK